MGKNINFSISLFTDPEMPARRGGDRTMNNCAPWRSHGCNVWENENNKYYTDLEGRRTTFNYLTRWG
jgi:hypothetical protein